MRMRKCDAFFHVLHRKVFAFARSPKTSPPMYTASAPKITATFNTSRLLAGTSNSGFLMLFPFYSLSSSCFRVPFAPVCPRQSYSVFCCFMVIAIPSPSGTTDVSSSGLWVVQTGIPASRLWIVRGSVAQRRNVTRLHRRPAVHCR